MTHPNTPIMNNGLILINEETLKSILSETVNNALASHLNELKQPEDTLLTTREAAELFRTTPVQLWRWELAGYFTSKKLGGKKYYSKKEIIEGMRQTRKFREIL